MAGNLKPYITRSDVFNVNYFLLRTIKVDEELLSFWLPCQKTHTSVPHHTIDQGLVMRGGAERFHRKMAAKTGLPQIQREHREQSDFDRLSRENM